MSAIVFQSKSQGKAKLHGAERHHMAMTVRKYGYEMNLNWAAVDADSDLSLLNACLNVGSDTLTLLARIHAQCESHCWVDGPNREWMADIISNGRKSGLYGFNTGWGEVEAFLRKCNDEPVFLSFSGSDPFPSEYCARGIAIWEEAKYWAPTKRYFANQIGDAMSQLYIPGNWDGLSPDHQWSLHEQVLRQQSAREDADPDAPFSLELRPSNWSSYFFE